MQRQTGHTIRAHQAPAPQQTTGCDCNNGPNGQVSSSPETVWRMVSRWRADWSGLILLCLASARFASGFPSQSAWHLTEEEENLRSICSSWNLPDPQRETLIWDSCKPQSPVHLHFPQSSPSYVALWTKTHKINPIIISKKPKCSNHSLEMEVTQRSRNYSNEDWSRLLLPVWTCHSDK